MADDRFYIIAREAGAEHPAIPTWANDSLNPAFLERSGSGVVAKSSIQSVKGAVQLTGVLSDSECSRLLQISEELGYLKDAAVSLPRSVRHNDNVTWVVDDETSDIIWRRCRALLEEEAEHYGGSLPLGLNNRFRFYRYHPGDYFSTHSDASWPGSRVIDRQLVQNAYPERWSRMTFLLFLSDQFEGGETRFLAPGWKKDKQSAVDVRTPRGGVLCFPHGDHPFHCLHGSLPITTGIKYIVRTDVMFELPGRTISRSE